MFFARILKVCRVFLFLSGTEQGVFGMSKTIKFGGTSLSCGKNIALAAGIIKKENVVVIKDEVKILFKDITIKLSFSKFLT